MELFSILTLHVGSENIDFQNLINHKILITSLKKIALIGLKVLVNPRLYQKGPVRDPA